jgi:hypothetical protein
MNDAYQFKKEIAAEESRIILVSAGYKNENNEIIRKREYIPVPKWYDQN